MRRAAAPSPSDAALERVRDICLNFPGAEEKLSHGSPSFHVRGKMFVMFVDDHHDDGRLAVWSKATMEEQKRLVAGAPDRFFVPPYVGVRGWVGVHLDHPHTDWVGLALLIEEGWVSVAPESLASDPAARPLPRKAPPPRLRTDPEVARDAFARLSGLCLRLPQATADGAGGVRHATFRVRRKVFVYFFNNHHSDGIVAACVKVAKGENAKLVKGDPKVFFLPPYIGAHGWVGMRLDAKKVDWKGVADRVAESYRAVAPKALQAEMAGPRRAARAAAR